MIIVTTLFSNSSVFKMFSIHTKTKSRRYQIFFRLKSSVIWTVDLVEGIRLCFHISPSRENGVITTCCYCGRYNYLSPVKQPITVRKNATPFSTFLNSNFTNIMGMNIILSCHHHKKKGVLKRLSSLILKTV